MSAHGGYGVFDDGESESGAAVGTAAGAVDGVEAFEDSFLVFGWDSAAAVFDFQDEFLGIERLVRGFGIVPSGVGMDSSDERADGDGSGGGEFDGVVDEVFEGEHEESFVAAEGFGVVAEFDAERDVFFSGAGGVEAADHFADPFEVDAVQCGRRRGRLRFGRGRGGPAPSSGGGGRGC